MLRHIKNQEQRIASSAQQSSASPIKEKRFGVFRLPTYRVNPSSAQQSCASPTKENDLAVFHLSTSYRIASSARLATSAKREVPRAGIAERLQ